MSLWHRGFSRDIWYFWKDNIGLFEPSKRKRKGVREKFQVRPYSNYETSAEELKEKTFTFKRLPKRWIPEFDKL